MILSYSNYTPPFNTSTAGLKSQPGLKFLHVTSPLENIMYKIKLPYINKVMRYTYLLKIIFNHACHTQHIFVKIQWVDFQMGRVILTNYLNSHPSLGHSGHTAFKLVKRGCLFRLRRKTIPQHCTTISKTTFKIVCFRFWKC